MYCCRGVVRLWEQSRGRRANSQFRRGDQMHSRIHHSLLQMHMLQYSSNEDHTNVTSTLELPEDFDNIKFCLETSSCCETARRWLRGARHHQPPASSSRSQLKLNNKTIDIAPTDRLTNVSSSKRAMSIALLFWYGDKCSVCQLIEVRQCL